MARARRRQRIAELLREELGTLILREVRDPRLASVTITGVEIAPDLGHAQVFVSLIGSEADRLDALAALERASGYLRRELAGRLELRHTPALSFRLDESIERGQRILSLLDQIEHPDTEEELSNGQ